MRCRILLRDGADAAVRIILHTGVWKTGSTAIQTFLSANAGLLAERGVLIPAYARRMAEYNHLFERLVAEDATGVQAVMDDVRADIAAQNPDVVVISSEHFWHAPKHIIECVAHHLSQITTDIKVIAYIRPQDDMWASLYAQQAKFFRVLPGHPIWGASDYIGSAISDHALYYHRCFQVYRDAFGEDAVDLRLYDRANFADGDVVQDFLGWIGIQDRTGFISSEKDENSSFGWKGVAFSLWLADRMKRGVAEFENSKAAGKALRFAMRDTGRRFDDVSWYGKAPECFGPDERARIRSHYANDTAALAQDYFGGESPFGPPPERAAEPLSLDLVPEQEFAFAKRRLRRRIAATYPLLSRERWLLKTEQA